MKPNTAAFSYLVEQHRHGGPEGAGDRISGGTLSRHGARSRTRSGSRHSTLTFRARFLVVVGLLAEGRL